MNPCIPSGRNRTALSRFGWPATVVLYLCACGGGSRPPPVVTTFTLPQQQISLVTTSDTLGAPEVALVTGTIANPPAGGVYLQASSTTNAILNFDFVLVNPTTTQLTVRFKPADQLAVGTYRDTVVLNVCYDAACSQPVAGSPFPFGTIYDVLVAGSSINGAPPTGTAASIVPVTANDLVWDPQHQRIYLSVPGTTPDGNVILAVDPTSGALLASQYAGSEPNVLSISDDGQYLYAGIDGTSSIQRFLLPDLTPDINFPLGASQTYGPYIAYDLKVAPGAPQTTAVSTGVTAFNGEAAPGATLGLTIYDNATARPTASYPSTPIYNSLQWGSDDTALYIANTGSGSNYDLYTFAINSQGATQTQDFPNTFSSSGALIHYDGGTQLIYADSGDVVQPTTGTRLGSFGVTGPMQPDSGSNTAAFVVSTQAATDSDVPSFAIQTFDQTQFTPKTVTPLNNVDTSPVHLVRWGTDGLAFNTVDGPVFLINSAAPTAAPLPGIPLGSATMTFVPVPANDIGWDAKDGLIFVSVPSSAGSNGNSITAINPTTGKVTATKITGNEPTVLAISGDDQYLYVGLSASSSVQRFVLPALTADISFSLPSDIYGSHYASDIQVAPGADQTTAIVLSTPNSAPIANGGIAIFDNAAMRPVKAGGMGSSEDIIFDTIQWGADSSTLYAANYEDNNHFYSLTVNASGVQEGNDYFDDFETFGSRIHFDNGNGLIYDDDGHVVLPATGLPAGRFNGSGTMVPDSSMNRAFIIGQTAVQSGGTYTIMSYDMQHYTPVEQYFLQDISGTPERLIRWGTNGLAFCTSAGVYLLSGPFVSNATSATTASARRDLPRRTW